MAAPYQPRPDPGGPYRLVVIGGSWGSMAALGDLLRPIPAGYPIPMVVVTHLHKSDTGGFSSHLATYSRLPVSEAVDKQQIEAGHIYTAPADYHLLVERDGALALSVDIKVNWAGPPSTCCSRARPTPLAVGWWG